MAKFGKLINIEDGYTETNSIGFRLVTEKVTVTLTIIDTQGTGLTDYAGGSDAPQSFLGADVYNIEIVGVTYRPELEVPNPYAFVVRLDTNRGIAEYMVYHTSEHNYTFPVRVSVYDRDTGLALYNGETLV